MREPALPVTVTNGLGAGDAFAAAFGYALLRGLERPARLANVAGALVATRHSCSTAMPTMAELETFIEEHQPAQGARR